MKHTSPVVQEYVMGDRMGDLEESLAGSLRVDCGENVYPAAGPVLWSDGREMVMDTGEAHTLVISSTGGGKTVSQVMPLLRAAIKGGESLFVTDVKAGELYEGAWPYLKQQGYRTWVINLRQPLRGARYNPLALPLMLLKSDRVDLQAMGHQLLAQAADALLLQRESETDPFWDQAARDTFLGLTYLLAALDQPEHFHLQGVYDLFSIGQASLRKLKILLDSVKGSLLGDTAWKLLRSRLFAESSPRTVGSIDSILAAKFNQFLGTPLQTDLLCGNDLDFSALDEERVAVFLLLPDETDIWQAHASLLVTQVYQYLCLLAGEHPGGRLPHRFHFLLEEFGNLALGDAAVSLFSAGRSRNIRVTAVVQNFSQLDHRYGKETADTIRFNCGNWFYLHTRDMDTLKLLSDLCGTRTYLNEGVTRPTASVGDLQRIQQGQALVFQNRKRPYLTQLAPIWAYPDTAPSCTAEYPSRKMEETSHLTVDHLIPTVLRQVTA